MPKIFFDIGLSLDGFIAGENRGPSNPLGDRGTEIHNWMFRQQYFIDRIHWPSRGENGLENQLVTNTFERAGAYIMGRNMFDEGEVSWPENAPFQAPVFVLTHRPREPWVRKGGTTFYFITDGIDAAMNAAREAAGDKDIRVSGGADNIRQFLERDLIDECSIHFSTVLLGRGLRLFDKPLMMKKKFEVVESIACGETLHTKYRLK